MNKPIQSILLVLALSLGVCAAVSAHDRREVRGMVTVWHAPSWGGPPLLHPAWPYPRPVYRPYPGWYGEWGWTWGHPYAAPMVVLAPHIYVERPAQPNVPPAGYWYWCPDAGGWYPTVRECKAGWQAVPPRRSGGADD